MTGMTSLSTKAGAAATRILGTGSYQPEKVVTNDDLAEIMDTNDEWIRERVGIIERRAAGPDDSVVSMGATAGARAIANAGLTGSDIDTVIVATCTMPTQIPNASARVLWSGYT